MDNLKVIKSYNDESLIFNRLLSMFKIIISDQNDTVLQKLIHKHFSQY